MTSFAEMNFLEEDSIQKYLKSMKLHDHLFQKYSLKFPMESSKLSRLYTFVFLRHPFERLASAFHDKFVKRQQVNIMKPFIQHYLQSHNLEIPRNFNDIEHWKDAENWIRQHVDVWFAKFVYFVLYESAMRKRIAGVSWHWWAFTDICKLCELEFNFIGKIETFQQDVSCLVNNFPKYAILQSMEHKTKEKVNANADHDKDLSMKYFSELTKSQVLDLYNLYELDFIVGGYKFPQQYIEVAKPDTKS